VGVVQDGVPGAAGPVGPARGGGLLPRRRAGRRRALAGGQMRRLANCSSRHRCAGLQKRRVVFKTDIYIYQASNDGQSSSILELDSYHKSAAPEIKWLGKKKVKIYKLSRILKTSKHNKIFIKIDTQGYEFEVLKSINKRTLAKILAFEIETNLVSTYKNVTVIEDVIKLLRGFGFKPFRLQNGFGMPNFGQQLQVDIIFVRNE
jgi:FkbM family methyltransferase